MPMVNQIIVFLAALVAAFAVLKVTTPVPNVLAQEGIVAIEALKTCKTIEMRKYRGALKVKCLEATP